MARVFISSRFEEFRELRSVVSRALADAPGLDVVALDDGRAATVGPHARSVTSLTDCDVMVLLLGRTYTDVDSASRAPGHETSTTHAEFRAARDSGIPVLAFSRDVTTMEPRAAAFAQEVQEHVVTGTLVSDPFDNLDRIRDTLDDWVTTMTESDGDADGASMTGQLMQELDYLGAPGLDQWALPAELSVNEPDYVRLIEQRRFALASLTSGDVGSAREHLMRARAIHAHDWSTNYVAARLLEVKNLRTELAVARAIAKDALGTVEDLVHAPVYRRRGGEDVVSRRKVATLTLRARLERRSGDVDTAARVARTAIELDRTSREALVELVRALGLQGDVEATTRAATTLLSIYPDRAARLMRSEDLALVQPAVETALIGFVMDLRADARAALGLPRATAGTTPRRLRDALELVRGEHAQARAELGHVTGAVWGLTEKGLPLVALEHRTVVLHETERLLRLTAAEMASADAAIRVIAAADELDDWKDVTVTEPAWAVAELAELATQTALVEQIEHDVAHLFTQLGRSRPERAVEWVEAQMPAERAHLAMRRARADRSAERRRRRSWWVVALVVLGYALLAADPEPVRAVAAAGASLALVLLVVNPRLPAPPPRTRRREAAAARVAVRCDALAQLHHLLGVERRARYRRDSARTRLPSMRNRLHSELYQLWQELRERHEKLTLQVADATEALTRAQAQRASTCRELGWDTTVPFREIASDLAARFVRYDHAYARYPNVVTDDYVPMRRARSGDVVSVKVEDSVVGGFLAEAADLPKRLVRLVSGFTLAPRQGTAGRRPVTAAHRHVTDAGLVLPALDPADVDAFETLLARELRDPALPAPRG
ncbi:DUF4062 domain-containing protein [Cellulomonas sp. KH9]|uniref:DUF4062 domain-containing protein n=1 Tax=Cellulomonas sp. KH9 TaxID=1855324 RepID=UPI0008E02FD0|nr:DUF4062 domain-containing protein [Cellulomonas sp. KH9]SFK33652.1 protein of unknown function [Cellulomonas sp. KH9]